MHKKGFLGFFTGLAIFIAILGAIVSYIVLMKFVGNIRPIEFSAKQVGYLGKSLNIRKVGEILNYPVVSLSGEPNLEWYVLKVNCYNSSVSPLCKAIKQYDPRLFIMKKIHFAGKDYKYICKTAPSYYYCVSCDLINKNCTECYNDNNKKYFDYVGSCIEIKEIVERTIYIVYPEMDIINKSSRFYFLDQMPTLFNVIMSADQEIKNTILPIAAYQGWDCKINSTTQIETCEYRFLPTSMFLNCIKVDGKTYGNCEGYSFKYCLEIDGKNICLYMVNESKYFT